MTQQDACDRRRIALLLTAPARTQVISWPALVPVTLTSVACFGSLHTQIDLRAEGRIFEMGGSLSELVNGNFKPIAQGSRRPYTGFVRESVASEMLASA